MTTYVIRRFLQAIPTVIITSVLVWAMVYALPGDPVIALLGVEAEESAIIAERARLGLDKPIYAQYVTWVGNLLQGDFGDSYFGGEAVGEKNRPKGDAHHPTRRVCVVLRSHPRVTDRILRITPAENLRRQDSERSERALAQRADLLGRNPVHPLLCGPVATVAVFLRLPPLLQITGAGDPQHSAAGSGARDLRLSDLRQVPAPITHRSAEQGLRAHRPRQGDSRRRR